MKPAAFDYVRAESLEEALEALHQEGADARVLAGGQTLIPMLNMRMARPSVIVDIMQIADLDCVEFLDGSVRVGATVRQHDLEQAPELSLRQPLLAAAVPWIGHAQTRSRGTICGSVAHADPSAELPLVLVALNGEIELRSRRRSRCLFADDFFTGVMSTACEPDEMIEAVSFPAACAGTGYAFREVGRRYGDFAIVACAAIVDRRAARLAIGGVAERPVATVLPPPGDPALDEALRAFTSDIEAHDDIHATAEYRRELVCRLGLQTIAEADRCRG
jgi:2-furoyl-CoA dehydrogenase FAD binding subunit